MQQARQRIVVTRLNINASIVGFTNGHYEVDVSTEVTRHLSQVVRPTWISGPPVHARTPCRLCRASVVTQCVILWCAHDHGTSHGLMVRPQLRGSTVV